MKQAVLLIANLLLAAGAWASDSYSVQRIIGNPQSDEHWTVCSIESGKITVVEDGRMTRVDDNIVSVDSLATEILASRQSPLITTVVHCIEKKPALTIRATAPGMNPFTLFRHGKDIRQRKDADSQHLILLAEVFCGQKILIPDPLGLSCNDCCDY